MRPVWFCLECPDARTIKTPTQTTEFSKGARAEYFSYVIHTWKHSNRTKIKPQRVRVERNPITAEFCPLYAFQFFSAISGQGEVVGMENKKGDAGKYVPMWPDFDPDTNTFNFYKKAGTVKLWAWVDALMKHSGLGQATPHSMRASACIWALRGYVECDYVKEGGRWVGTGTSWRKYFQQGSAFRFKYARGGGG